MSILFYGNEEFDYTKDKIGMYDPTIYTQYKRTRVRESNVNPLDYYSSTPTRRIKFSESTNKGYISFRFGAFAYATPIEVGDGYPLISFYDVVEEIDGYIDRFSIFYDTERGFSMGYMDNGNPTLLYSNSTVKMHENDIIHHINIYFNFTDVQNSIVDVNVDNITALHWVGDVSSFIDTGVISSAIIHPLRTSNGGYFTEVIASDDTTDISKYGVSTVPIPSSASIGTDNDFINPTQIYNYNVSNSISYSNVSLAFCKNSGDKQSYMCSSLLDAPTEYNNILKFKMTALVKRAPHGPSRLRFYLVLDGIRYYSDYYDVYTYFTTINYEQDVRPDNGEPWTNDDLDYIEVGMEGAE